MSNDLLLYIKKSMTRAINKAIFVTGMMCKVVHKLYSKLHYIQVPARILAAFVLLIVSKKKNCVN